MQNDRKTLTQAIHWQMTIIIPLAKITGFVQIIIIIFRNLKLTHLYPKLQLLLEEVLQMYICL